MLLQKYVLRELLVAFLLTLLAITLVILTAITAHQLHLYKGLGLAFLASALPYTVPFVLSLAIPFAAVVAAALVFGRFAADREIDAMRACGVHLLRPLAPGLLLGFLLSLACLYLNNVLVPYCHYQKRELALRSLETIVTSPAFGNRNIPIGDYEFLYTDIGDGAFRGITFVKNDPDSGRIAEMLFAATCRFYLQEAENCLIAEFGNGTGMRYTRDPKTGALVEETIVFEKYEEPFQLDKIFSDGERTVANMSNYELHSLGTKKIGTKYKPHRLLTELHRRNAFSFAPLVLILAVAPLGLLARPGGKLAGVGIAIVPVLLYFIAYLGGQHLGAHGTLAPEIASWGPPALIAGLSFPLFAWIFNR